ncbi:MAG TPA: hypothetical protein VGM50_13845, partial [Gemmatimonadaceae bacterium]
KEARRLSFPERGLSILAVPDVPNLVRPSLTPDPEARYNVLLIHGEVQGVLPANVANADRASLEISHEELGAARWDYVALGHYHVYREVAPNAYYSGSLDYTSANPWGELYEERLAGIAGKGFVERNLDSGEQTFHPLPASRPLIDLPAIGARGLMATEIDERIRAAVDGCIGSIDDKVVRLVVRDVPRHIARELDHKAIRDYKRRALNFHLDVRRPDAYRKDSTGAPGRRQMLDIKDIVASKLRIRPLDADLDRDVLIGRAVEYLEEAQTMAVAPATLLED